MKKKNMKTNADKKGIRVAEKSLDVGHELVIGKTMKKQEAHETEEVKKQIKESKGKIHESEKIVKKENFSNTEKPRKKNRKSSGGDYGESVVSNRRLYLVGFFIGILASLITFYLSRGFVRSGIAFFAVFSLFLLYAFITWKVNQAAGVRKMEEVFPDFISLMASNLRAGMTIDSALLLSSRKEFAPLDKEIALLGKDIVTGREITHALSDAAKRIGSEKIDRTIMLIISGIKAGGNLAILLEETSQNMRERGFVEKRAASNVLMYVIFIFFATAFGAPLLFGLSSVLVEVLSDIVSNLPTEQSITNVPFALTSISVSTNFIFYFSLIFLIVTAFLASLVLGLVSKGREKEGLKYFLPLVLVGLTLFFVSRFFLLRYFSGLFS